ncbi:MAG: hypothetical protein L0K86_09470 [Actinomycetia bacterium]|nr:hypothetical protein [Actinomycetes bacterium]
MELHFRRDDVSGSVAVDVQGNTNPAKLGCDAASLGLPVCTASVETVAEGYRAMCGWIQVVCSTDNSTGGKGFDMDPFAPSGTDSPYAFYGLAPTLFDAPSRDNRDDLDWLAHAFLAHTPLGTTQVEAAAGFSWGFRFRAQKVQIIAPSPLDHTDWAAHLRLFTAEYPGWTFPPMSPT